MWTFAIWPCYKIHRDKLNAADLPWLSPRQNCGVMPSLLAIVVLGLFLGMRHATDPDHVVAITTIVSRERTTWHAAIIGALWGLGHTVTIIVVGSAIILLKLTIPPALGLTMELSVACMLILLGILNLTGVLAPDDGLAGDPRLWSAARMLTSFPDA